MSVITKRGDSGETDLMFGRRSPKTAPRIEAYGTVDELNSLIGVVRHSGVSSRTVEMLDGVQARLVGAMGELATMEEGSLGSAYLDLARSVCRRAERRVVALRLDHALSNVNTALFLNRLSDLCWVLARFEALAAGEKAQA